MNKILIQEIKLNIKNLLIWSISVGGMGMACILLYSSMQGDIKDMADAFSNMGAFSDAFGMSTLSIATIGGYFATEVGTVHSLGSGMFAAILAICIISKEEEGHSGEFLLSLPVSRNKVLCAKGLYVFITIIVFTIICALFYLLGFNILDEEPPMKEFISFMFFQCLMDLEVAGICFAISALSGKNRMGLGIGISMMLYVYDLIGRVVPDMKDYLFIGPYSFANASDIFSGNDVEVKAVVLAIGIMVITVFGAFYIYNRRDLAS